MYFNYVKEKCLLFFQKTGWTVEAADSGTKYEDVNLLEKVCIVRIIRTPVCGGYFTCNYIMPFNCVTFLAYTRYGPCELSTFKLNQIPFNFRNGQIMMNGKTSQWEFTRLSISL